MIYNSIKHMLQNVLNLVHCTTQYFLTCSEQTKEIVDFILHKKKLSKRTNNRKVQT